MQLIVHLWVALRAWADEPVNLSDLGMEGFTPYVVERNPAWILLPALTLAVVLLHLKKNRKKKIRRDSV